MSSQILEPGAAGTMFPNSPTVLREDFAQEVVIMRNVLVRLVKYMVFILT